MVNETPSTATCSTTQAPLPRPAALRLHGPTKHKTCTSKITALKNRKKNK